MIIIAVVLLSRYFKDVKYSITCMVTKKLISIGLRPINALVDITNFITHDLGGPLCTDVIKLENLYEIS